MSIKVLRRINIFLCFTVALEYSLTLGWDVFLMGNPRPLFRLFSSFQTSNIYNKKEQNVYYTE